MTRSTRLRRVLSRHLLLYSQCVHCKHSFMHNWQIKIPSSITPAANWQTYSVWRYLPIEEPRERTYPYRPRVPLMMQRKCLVCSAWWRINKLPIAIVVSRPCVLTTGTEALIYPFRSPFLSAFDAVRPAVWNQDVYAFSCLCVLLGSLSRETQLILQKSALLWLKSTIMQ